MRAERKKALILESEWDSNEKEVSARALFYYHYSAIGKKLVQN